MLPDFKYERRLWRKGYKFVVGADEVGRGAWSGPVVAGAVVFPSHIAIQPFSHEAIRIDDSKKLTARQRERAATWIKSNALAWGIGKVPVSVINRLGMGKASKMAFRAAIKDCKQKLDFLLIDAFYLPYTRGLKRKNQLAIIDGDEKSFSIASASILAKVYRDRLMRQLSCKHPQYGWGRNKGYGTREHQEAIRKYSLTRLHRNQFIHLRMT